jgi:hypothetical protein
MARSPMKKSYFEGKWVKNPQCTPLEGIDDFKGFVDNLKSHIKMLNISREEFDGLPKKAQKAKKCEIPYFIAGVPENPSEGVSRARTSCKDHANNICLDIDVHEEALKALAALKKDFPFNAVWYETIRSRPDWVRIRLVVAAEGIPNDRYKAAVSVTAKALGVKNFDMQSNVINQPMFRPAYFSDEPPPKVNTITDRRELTLADLEDVEILEKNHNPANGINGIEHLKPTSDDITQTETEKMLLFIDPNSGYEIWIKVCAALNHQFQHDTEKGYRIFDEWSGKGVLYQGEDETRKKWNSVTANPNREPITIKTLIRLAQNEGYQPPIPNPAIDIDEPLTVFLPSGSITANDTAAAISQKLGNKLFFYRYAEQLVVISNGQLETVSDPYRFGNLVEEKLRFKAWILYKEQLVPKKKKPPTEDLRRILKSRTLLEGLPPIVQVVRSPYLMLRSNDTLEQLRKGYNPSSGIYVTGDAEQPHDVPLPEALMKLKQIHKEFFFAGEADFSRAITMMLTPALKIGGFIQGNVPIDFAEATESQSGKTYRLQLIRTLYNETAQIITGHDGGVGSLDEHIASAIAAGKMFVAFDNLRGRIDSQKLEAFMTADPKADCPEVRLPHKGYVKVIPGKTLFQMSSNGVRMTQDLANRSCISRIHKAEEGFEYRSYREGDLKDHIEANQPYYMGCVNAIITEWHRQGMPIDQSGERHDFREWHEKLNWIVKNLFKLPPIMDGHRDKQRLVANDCQSFVRNLASRINSEGRANEWFKPTELEGYCEQAWAPPGKKLNCWTIGWMLAKFMDSGDYKELEDWRIERIVNGKQKLYLFSGINDPDDIDPLS